MNVVKRCRLLVKIRLHNDAWFSVRYAFAPADMADKTEKDANEGVFGKGSSSNELLKPKPDEQLVLLSSAS